MSEDKHMSPRQLAFKWRFIYLLVFILMLIGLKPLAEVYDGLNTFLGIVLTAVLIAAINAVSQKKANTVIGIILAAPMLIATWSALFIDRPWLGVAADLCAIVFFTFLVVTILTFVIDQESITRDLISGAAVVYLLLAMVWMFIYRVLETVHPGSLYISESHIIGNQFPFMYFSFVTITTLGYGDIYPITTAARSLAALEALIGQIYLVFTVARLVGLYTSQSEDKKIDGEMGRLGDWERMTGRLGE